MDDVTATLPRRIDDFEYELACVEALIDLVYLSPEGHPCHAKYLEDLHTHRLEIAEKYAVLRRDIFECVFK